MSVKYRVIVTTMVEPDDGIAHDVIVQWHTVFEAVVDEFSLPALCALLYPPAKRKHRTKAAAP